MSDGLSSNHVVAETAEILDMEFNSIAVVE
jgi:hypothetical protein